MSLPRHWQNHFLGVDGQEVTRRYIKIDHESTVGPSSLHCQTIMGLTAIGQTAVSTGEAIPFWGVGPWNSYEQVQATCRARKTRCFPRSVQCSPWAWVPGILIQHVRHDRHNT